MEEKLVNYLKEKYNPLGIILHGSRSDGYAREHSDWDFFVFVDEEIKNDRKYELVFVNNQYLDVVVWQFPPEEKYLKKYFAKYCGTAKLLFHNNSSVFEFFSKSQNMHNQGLELMEEEIEKIKEEISKGIERIGDWMDDDTGVFFVRASDLFRIIYNAWWNIKMKRYSVSPRKGMEVIKKEDKDFYELLKIVSGNGTNTGKHNALLELKEIIFS